MDVGDRKKALRTELKARLEAGPADRARASARIAEKLRGLPEYRAAATVCLYASMPLEVDTSAMIDAALADGKRVLLPRTEFALRALRVYEVRSRAELAPGTLGILEPAAERSREAQAAEADLVVVPALGFDRTGNRLGRGAGLYDRFLKGLRPGTPKIGVAYAFQIVDSVPSEAHDVRMDRILTEE